MLIKERDIIPKSEIEAKLTTVGDYVKIDYLSQCLKKNLDFDTRKFVLMKLSEIYESLKMYFEAARMIRNASDINATYDNKLKYHLKSMELFIKAGNYDEAEISFTKVLSFTKEIQKNQVKAQHKEAYKKQAQELFKNSKLKNAMIIYERYLRFADLSLVERKEAQSELLKLYERLGKITEYSGLKNSMNAPPSQTRQPQSIREKKDDFDVDSFLGPAKTERKPRSFY